MEDQNEKSEEKITEVETRISRRKLKKKKRQEEKLAEIKRQEMGVEAPEEKPIESESKKEEFEKETGEEQPKEQIFEKEPIEKNPEEQIQKENIEEKSKKEEKPATGEPIESSEFAVKKEYEEEKTEEGGEIEVTPKNIGNNIGSKIGYKENEETEKIISEPSEEIQTPSGKEAEESEEPEEIGEEQILVRPESKNAIIEDIRIAKIRDLWKKKPKSLSLETDAIIITLKTFQGKIIKETFYTHLDSDNNLRYERTSTANQKNFINFLQNYNLAESLENYNVIDRSKEWKGKTVEINENDRIVVS